MPSPDEGVAPVSTNFGIDSGYRILRKSLLLLNEPGGSRTHDLRIKSPLLYQLSYRLNYPI